MMQNDYPAAHSMDAEWFAIDDAGEVALMKTNEDGPVPEGISVQNDLFEFLAALPKDQQGMPLFPIQYDPFAGEHELVDVLKKFHALPQEVQSLLRALAPNPTSECQEKFRQYHPGVATVIILLQDGTDVSLLSVDDPWKVRLRDDRALYFFERVVWSECVRLALLGKVLALRYVKNYERDYLVLCDVLGIYSYSAEYSESEKYWEQALCPPREEPQKYYVELAAKPCTLPHTINMLDYMQGVKRIFHIPTAHFAQMPTFQIADYLPSHSWSNLISAPFSGDAKVRRYMTLLHSGLLQARESQVQQWQQEAQEGDLLAQYCLGYFHNEIEPCDKEAAMYWFRMAAQQAEKTPPTSSDMFENGSAAQFSLAEMLAHELPLDAENDAGRVAEMLDWYQKAAARENYIAQFRLAEFYLHGHYVQQDREQCLAWLRKSDEHYYRPAYELLYDLVPEECEW